MKHVFRDLVLKVLFSSVKIESPIHNSYTKKESNIFITLFFDCSLRIFIGPIF